MEQTKYLYWSYQSSQALEPSEEELRLFQNKYKSDFEQRTMYEDQELLDKYRLNGWRNALFSSITSIIVAFEHEGTLRTKQITGTEKDLLQTFVNLLKNQFKDYTLVHFDAGIVLPYIGVRLQKNGHINSPNIGLKYQGCRPWELKGVDIKQYFKGAGDYSYSLEEIAYILNLDNQGIIPYCDEFTYFNSGDLESLSKSAIRQIEVLSSIHRTLNELPLLQTVLIEEKVEDVQEVKPTDWAKELYISKKLTKDIKEGLIGQLKKKKLLKKDRETVADILTSVYINSEMFHKEKDTEASAKTKNNEIKALLDEIK